MIIDILFLPMLIFIGLITSWEDFKGGKIRNKWIVIGLIYGLAIFAGLFLWNLFAEPITQYYYTNIKELGMDEFRPVFTVNYQYFSQVALNSIIALVLGFFLWRYGLLAAGDAKLFFVFSLLLPLKYYWKSYLPYFPSFTLLINIFLPVLFFIFLSSCFYLLKTLKKLIRDRKFNIKINKHKFRKGLSEIFVMLLGFTAVFLLMDGISHIIDSRHLGNLPNKSLLLIAMVFLYRPMFTVIKKNKKILYIISIFIVFYMVYGFINNPAQTIMKLFRMLKILALFMGLLQIFRKTFDYYIKNIGIIQISTKELKPGMSPVLEKQQKKDVLRADYAIGNIFGGGLTKEQVDLLKKWAKKNNIKNIKIYKRFAFAAWMFLGVLITIFTKCAITKYIF